MANQHSSPERPSTTVGAFAVDISPEEPTFLYGYPHVPRTSTGIHDPLLASAIYLNDGSQAVVFVNVDIIWLSKRQVGNARKRIAAEIGVPPSHVMITATHTHSGPVTIKMISNGNDPVVPSPDSSYLNHLLDGIVASALQAFRRAVPAELAFVTTECAEIGGNRHDRNGPTVTEIPIVAARAVGTESRWLGLMYVNRVHPTVLHEDSTLVSGDFPGLCRRILQNELIGLDCPVLCHLGAAGNQSPRYVTQSNTYAEAKRLGQSLAATIRSSLDAAEFSSHWRIGIELTTVDLPLRSMPTLDEASSLLASLKRRHEELYAGGAEPGQIRTAECAVFGGEETVCLARAALNGELEAAARRCLPAEIQIISLGTWQFVAWPGEVFSEFALRVRETAPNTFVITLGNGELQGYLVTQDAVQQNVYEACNAIFSSPRSGELLVQKTLALLAQMSDKMSDTR